MNISPMAPQRPAVVYTSLIKINMDSLKALQIICLRDIEELSQLLMEMDKTMSCIGGLQRNIAYAQKITNLWKNEWSISYANYSKAHPSSSPDNFLYEPTLAESVELKKIFQTIDVEDPGILENLEQQTDSKHPRYRYQEIMALSCIADQRVAEFDVTQSRLNGEVTMLSQESSSLWSFLTQLFDLYYNQESNFLQTG